MGRHWVIAPPTGLHVVVEQRVHCGAQLFQNARQNAINALTSSFAQALHDLQKSETSQRSPVLPVGVHVPETHEYPGAQFVATFAIVHWLVHALVGKQ